MRSQTARFFHLARYENLCHDAASIRGDGMPDNQELAQFANAQLTTVNNAIAALNTTLVQLGVTSVALSPAAATTQASIAATTFADPGD
jgi:hypothetical protein